MYHSPMHCGLADRFWGRASARRGGARGGPAMLLGAQGRRRMSRDSPLPMAGEGLGVRVGGARGGPAMLLGAQGSRCMSRDSPLPMAGEGLGVEPDCAVKCRPCWLVDALSPDLHRLCRHHPYLSRTAHGLGRTHSRLHSPRRCRHHHQGFLLHSHTTPSLSRSSMNG